jgi:hypothetical protein
MPPAVPPHSPPDAPLQVIDVRDLAAFMLGRIEAADSGVFGVAAGLHCRSFARIVADTLAWDQQRRQPDLRTGLSKEKERELLATWHGR